MKEIFTNRQSQVREYLLGSLRDQAEMRRLEEMLLLDDEFAERLAIAEDDLIEEYLNEALNADELKRFRRFFLASPANRRNLELARNLRKYAARQNTAPKIKNISAAKTAWFDWRNLCALPSVRLAAAGLLLCAAAFGGWRAFFYQSDIEKGLAQLQIAYRSERNVEARLIGFDYAPLKNLRGAADGDDFDAKSPRRRAEGFLMHAAAENENARTLHALGKFYLTEKKFEAANEQFERAAKFAPGDAQVQSDWGASLFEAGKKSAFEGSGARSLEFFDRSLHRLGKAIELNPQLAEPRFNRALCLQTMKAFEEAKKAWREYLEIDANSQWAEEARRNLKSLEAQPTEDRSAEEFERDFFAAFRQKNDDEAWRLLSRNRELIQEKYLPQRLAAASLKNSGDAQKDILAALNYVGELEKKRAGDFFAGEIAVFYTNLPADKIASLSEAQAAIRLGYQLGRSEKYAEALTEFELARRLFLQAGNVWEAALSDYSIAYYLNNSNQLNRSLTAFQQIADDCQSRNYRWLEQSARHWTATVYTALRKYTAAKKNYQKALAISEEIGDLQAVQKNLNELANLSSLVGEKTSALNYAQRIIAAPDAANASSRQKWRNYYTTLKVLIAAELYSAAKVFGSEAIYLADKNRNPVFATLSYIGTGSAHIRSGNYAEARRWLDDGYRKAELMPDASARKKMTAYSLLRMAYLDRETGNYENSLALYDQAINSYETLELPFYLYEAHKGRLLTHLALGNDAEVERQIPTTLALVERYREEIAEEQERSRFFDTEQSIYDTAVGFEFGRGNYERAYDYAEISNARSLLARLREDTANSSKKTPNDSEKNIEPLPLSEIRRRMPENVQLLQFTVLENEILIWLVSREKLIVVPSKIKAGDLSGKIENYSKLLRRRDSAAQIEVRETARELYDLLVNPIIEHLDPARELCVIPNKSLFHLPFATLLAPDENYLLTRFNIFYAPSANVFLVCTEKARTKKAAPPETLLSVGNPSFDRQTFNDLPDLPEAEVEAREIARFYDETRVLIGRDATKPAFLAALKTAEIVHFAGHYAVAPNAPDASGLLLSKTSDDAAENILTVAELSGGKLPLAKLIVLSACETGAESLYNGEGFTGLARAFLAADAPLVVGSHWKVDSEAAAEIMKRFHFYRQKENLSTTAALRRAQIEMFGAPDGRFREPFYWAAFAVFGGSAQF